MGTVSVDGRGRITLPKDLRERHGEDYRLVEAHNEIILIPIPDDPLATFQENGMTDRDRGDVQQEIQDSAREQVEDDVR